MNIPMHRFKYTKLTKDEIGKKLKAAETGPKCVSEFSDILSGKSLKIITKDGPVLEYSFRDKNELIISENGGKKIKTVMVALTLSRWFYSLI
jgi:hypothetical protein